MKIQKFEDIVAWKKSRSLIKLIYQISSIGKLDRDYDLKNQIQRAGISVMSNIAEGYGRRSNCEFSRFLDIAHGSCEEVKSLLFVGIDLKYILQEQFDQLLSLNKEISVMIRSFSNYLRRNQDKIK